MFVLDCLVFFLNIYSLVFVHYFGQSNVVNHTAANFHSYFRLDMYMEHSITRTFT